MWPDWERQVTNPHRTCQWGTGPSSPLLQAVGRSFGRYSMRANVFNISAREDGRPMEMRGHGHQPPLAFCTPAQPRDRRRRVHQRKLYLSGCDRAVSFRPKTEL